MQIKILLKPQKNGLKNHLTFFFYCFIPQNFHRNLKCVNAYLKVKYQEKRCFTLQNFYFT